MIRTVDPQPRIYGRLRVFTVVDERLRYVRVYVPKNASTNDDVTRTINFALDSRNPPLPKEGNDNG